MLSFSEQYGYKSVKSVIQLESIDNDLRNGLWNALLIYYWERYSKRFISEGPTSLRELLRAIWQDQFKIPLDTLPPKWDDAKKIVRTYFFECRWNEVYDFIQFVANDYSYDARESGFVEYCNHIMERELSGYRFVGKRITPITEPEEIAAIDEALQSTDIFKPVTVHLVSALDKLSDRESPDYRNSVKESISAIESMCTLLAGRDKAELKDALETLKNKIDIHPALQRAFNAMYGYTSDEDGIRHAMLEESDVGFEDAKFMLVACSAFINYLKVKADKASINLETK